MKDAIFKFFSYRFNLDEDKAEEEEIVLSVRKNVEFKGTNLWALIFAIFIASIGLNVNSTAVIIGAMLISPIMGPIMGVGLGLGIFDSGLIKLSLKNLMIAITISLVTSWLYFSLSPLHEAQSELLARTRPTIWDVLIALFGGLAGVIASTRKNISNTIPGVAIATALMPPLCTAGYGLASGNIKYFAGAFYLFIINSVFISISTFLIIRFLKFKAVKFVNEVAERKLRRIVWTVATLTIIPSVYLAYAFVNEEIFEQKTIHFINGEVKARELYVIDKTIEPLNKKVRVIVYGKEVNDSLRQLIVRNKDKYGLGDVEIVIQQARTEGISTKDLNLLREDIQQQMMVQSGASIQKDKKIKQLESELSKRGSVVNSSNIYKEFKAIYGDVKEFAINKSPVYGKEKIDTIYIAYIKPMNTRQKLNAEQIETWLKARFESEKTRVIIERN